MRATRESARMRVSWRRAFRLAARRMQRHAATNHRRDPIRRQRLARPSCHFNYHALAPNDSSLARRYRRSGDCGERSVYPSLSWTPDSLPRVILAFSTSRSTEHRSFSWTSTRREFNAARTHPRSCVREREHARTRARACAMCKCIVWVWIVGRSRVRVCERDRVRAVPTRRRPCNKCQEE